MLSFFIYLDEGNKSSDDKSSKLDDIIAKLADILAKVDDISTKPAVIRFQREVEIKENVIGTARFKQTNKKWFLNSSFLRNDIEKEEIGIPISSIYFSCPSRLHAYASRLDFSGQVCKEAHSK